MIRLQAKNNRIWLIHVLSRAFLDTFFVVNLLVFHQFKNGEKRFEIVGPRIYVPNFVKIGSVVFPEKLDTRRRRLRRRRNSPKRARENTNHTRRFAPRLICQMFQFLQK